MIFRKRKRVSVIVALIVLLVGLAVWRPWHHESSYHGKPTSYWVNQALQNQNSETIEAIKVLWPEAAMPLLKALKASDSWLKPYAIRFHGKLPRSFQKLIKSPVENDGVRVRAYRTLNLVSDSIKGPKSKPLVPTLIQYLSDDDQRPSLSTVDADTHIPLRHREFVRSVSADILASIGPDAMEAVPALVAALKDKDWSKYHMYLVPRALGKIGPDAKTAVPALQQFLNENPDTSPWAAEALWRIDPAQATVANESLGKAFIHTNRFTRVKAARVHWKINQKPDVVSPILIELMKDSQNLWVIDTMRALQDVTPPATNALEVLKERLNDGESSVRSVAAEVITSIERASAKATDASQKQSK